MPSWPCGRERRSWFAGNSPEGARKAKAALGGDVEALSFDVGDEAAVRNAFDGIGPFDHLVTTAAKLTYAPLGELPVAAVTEMLATKFWGPFFAARSASKLLRPGGSITFFSGLAADRPGPGTSIVSAVNAGLEGFARALAVELAPLARELRLPGVTETAGWNFMPEADRKAFFDGLRKSLPARRVGQPEIRRSGAGVDDEPVHHRHRPALRRRRPSLLRRTRAAPCRRRPHSHRREDGP